MTVVAVLEAVSVGLLVRHRFGPALASLGFWACFGVPLLYLSCAWMLRLDLHVVTMLALTQALNGVANALLLQIVMSWPPAKSWLRGSERERVGASPDPDLRELHRPRGLSGARARDRARAASSPWTRSVTHSSELVERVSIVGARIDEYVSAHERAAQSIGPAAGDGRDAFGATSSACSLSAHRLYPAFDKLVATDAAGEAMGGSHIRSGTPGVMGVYGSISHQRYFSEPMRTGRPYRSDIFLTGNADKAPAHRPRTRRSSSVPPSAAGIVKASLNLREVGRIAGDLVELSAHDAHGRPTIAAWSSPRPAGRAGSDSRTSAAAPGCSRRSARVAGEYRAPADATRIGGALPHRALRHAGDAVARLHAAIGPRGPAAGGALLRRHRRPRRVQPDRRGGAGGADGRPRLAAARAGGGRNARRHARGGSRPGRTRSMPRAPVEVQALQRDLEALVARLRERDAHLRQAVADREAAHAELERTLGRARDARPRAHGRAGRRLARAPSRRPGPRASSSPT